MGNFARHDAPVEVSGNNGTRVNPEAFTKSGTMEIDTMDGSVKTGQHRVDSHNLPSPHEGDILSTLRTQSGSPILSADRLTDDCIVSVSGVDMTVAQAKGMGLLKDTTGRGDLSETGKTAKDMNNKPDTTESALQDFSGGSKQVMNTLKAGFGEPTMNQLTNSIIGGLTAEDLNGKPVSEEVAMEKAVNSFVRITGSEPELAHSAVTSIIQNHTKEAAAFITRNHKVDGQQVFDWAYEHASPSVKADLYRRVLFGDKSVLSELVGRYQRRAR